ncbi:hypothetical protein RSOLAG22IIIB_09207 [Rhizoctonia solani]|uniref:Extracellular metalloproteinase n=1 Tax=Rhizoctonia solani TaxID=456999 RepID=A0A0K6FXV8_9AGAM|nr:hypothetical protein RSOLAG22IIIB_09207 [Rhizoctonia solani]
MMRPRHSVVSLAFALLVVSSNASLIRKSLRFGLRHPTARYVTTPHINNTLRSAFAADVNPLDVARAFMHSHTDSDYYIRDDSYTDKNTGITHVYVRQLFHGLEVADGDINLNVRNGQVLSFGDSFFRGLALPLDTHPPASYDTYCASFSSRILVPYTGSQITLSENAKAKEDWYALHCTRPLEAVRQAATMTGTHQDTSDPRHAAIFFMIAAHPEPLLVEKLVRDFGAIVEQMTLSHEYLSIGPDIDQSFTISGLPGSVGPVKARMVYAQIPAGNETALHATWRLEVEMTHNWYEAYVSVRDPSAIVSVADWTSDSSTPPHGDFLNALEAKLAMNAPMQHTEAGAYKVWKWGVIDPESGERTVEPASYDALASPLGWHTIPRISNPKGSPKWIGKGGEDDGGQNLKFTTTWGNNVFAQENWKGSRDEWVSNYRPEGGENLNFTFEYEVKDGVDSDPKNYVNLSITQLFYTSNMVHDLYYRYGFDELAGNFQQGNFGRGGRGDDAVIINAQDGGGRNDASFTSPPDGWNGRCSIFIWDTATPCRDGSLDAGIVIHEVTHGLSGRLTGGPANSRCLSMNEGPGLNEGWSDFFATTILSTKDLNDYAFGGWVSNKPTGVRSHLYSTNITVNPSMYSTLNDFPLYKAHDIGAVWAEILWIVSQKLVKKHGYSPTLFPPAPKANGSIPIGDFYNHPKENNAPLVPKHGNTLMLQLVILGLKLQPCAPTFLSARDAIIHADQTLTGGENLCDLWAGFSSRGLGRDAVVDGDNYLWGGGKYRDGFAVPDECK